MISDFLLYGGSEGAADRAKFTICCLVFWWSTFVSVIQSMLQFILVVCMLGLLWDYLTGGSVWGVPVCGFCVLWLCYVCDSVSQLLCYA
jgi:hypothetical protein